MLYCDPCAKKYAWPVGWFKSYGPCEMCGKTRKCNDTPSKDLPIRPENAS